MQTGSRGSDVEIDAAAGIARVARDCVRRGAPSLAVEHALADFGKSVEILLRGECHVMDDTRCPSLLADADRPV